MIVKHNELKPVLIEEIKDIVCNMCGESCKGQLNMLATSVDVEGGYDSPYLSDGVRYHFDLCEKCLTKIIKDLKIPPDEEY